MRLLSVTAVMGLLIGFSCVFAQEPAQDNPAPANAEANDVKAAMPKRQAPAKAIAKAKSKYVDDVSPESIGTPVRLTPVQLATLRQLGSPGNLQADAFERLSDQFGTVYKVRQVPTQTGRHTVHLGSNSESLGVSDDGTGWFVSLDGESGISSYAPMPVIFVPWSAKAPGNPVVLPPTANGYRGGHGYHGHGIGYYLVGNVASPSDNVVHPSVQAKKTLDKKNGNKPTPKNGKAKAQPDVEVNVKVNTNTKPEGVKGTETPPDGVEGVNTKPEGVKGVETTPDGVKGTEDTP